MKKLLLFLFFLVPVVMNGQNKYLKVVMKSGTVVVGELKEFDAFDHVTLLVAGQDEVIPMSEVAYVDKLDPSKIVREKVKVSGAEDFRGFVLAKGNNVFVYSENTDYEVAGAQNLKELLKKDGFWNVVDDMNQAHFFVNYFVNVNGAPKAIVSVSSWKNNSVRELKVISTDNTVAGNRNASEQLYYRGILPLQQKISSGSLSKSMLEDFTIK